MAVQNSVAVRNARLASFAATIGASAVLKIFAGTKPADCAAADAGTVLATLTLPSTWMAAPSAGVAAMTGTWQDLSADAAGVATYYRIYASGGTVCGEQGSCGASGSGADMILSDVNITLAQVFQVLTYQRTAGNA